LSNNSGTRIISTFFFQMAHPEAASSVTVGRHHCEMCSLITAHEFRWVPVARAHKRLSSVTVGHPPLGEIVFAYHCWNLGELLARLLHSWWKQVYMWCQCLSQRSQHGNSYVTDNIGMYGTYTYRPVQSPFLRRVPMVWTCRALVFAAPSPADRPKRLPYAPLLLALRSRTYLHWFFEP
jgi:hypothetical protein